MQGKPRIVSQQYLGSAEEVMAKLAGAPAGEPVRSQHKRFGDLAAVWSVLERLDVAGVIDEVVPAPGRRGRVGGHLHGVGHREPDRGPVLEAGVRRLVGHHRRAPVGQDAGRRGGSPPVLGRDGPPRQRRPGGRSRPSSGRRMVTEFGLDLSGLVLDMTNFATFIDTGNDQAPIAQRGKAKQKRIDLRLVGLALVVTRDGGVPLVSHAYPGDRPDVTQFTAVIDELVARYRDLVASAWSR